MPRAALTLLVVLANLLQPALSTPARAAPDDTPIIVVDDSSFDWDIGNGLLYWSYNCSTGGEFPNEGHLKRKPLYAGGISVLSAQGNTIDTCKDSFTSLSADATGLYYYNSRKGQLEFRPSGSASNPGTPIATINDEPPVPYSSLQMTDDFVYWISFNNKVMRVRKDGTERVKIADAPGATDLLVVGNSLYWLDNGGLWLVNLSSCTAPPCAKDNLVVTQGHGLLYASGGRGGVFVNLTYSIYWVETTGADKIRRYTCSLLTPGCSTATVYTSPNDHVWTLGNLARSGNLLFWPEGYFETGMGGQKRLRRLDLGTTGATPQNIAEEIAFFPGLYTDGFVFADSLNVYFRYQSRVARLPLDAAAIVHDLVADAFEVTQGNQNLANDTPLVAKKTTYVRAYPRQLTGPGAINVVARLHGTRNGSPLPGSPLASLNGTRSVGTGGSYDRANLNAGWLFQLPASWISGGAINLRVEVDPLKSYDDPNRANNELARNVTFNSKGVVCTLFVNVRTSAPAPSTNNQSFWPMIDYAKRLWPTRDYWVYRVNAKIEELEACWWGPFPYPCGGPFELPSDSWKVFLGLGTVDAFTDDPDECDAAGGSTHYVGMVHQSSSTGSTTGTGMTSVFNYSWVKFSSDSPVPATETFDPRSGSTLAHELAHNLGRKHVNCGSPDDPDGSYPYPANQIDNTGNSNHYGFDIKTRKPIAPASASDYMSYCTPKWTSDYTWKALYNKLVVADVAAAGATDLASAANVILVSGAVTPTQNSGYLGYAWNFPTAALSAKTLQKWQKLTAAEVAAAAVEQGATVNANYRVRLLDAANNVLADNPVTPVAPLVHEGPSLTLFFLATFPAPAGAVAKVELLQDSTVIATLAPGAAVPTVAMVKPAGGETIDQQLEVSWQASDADAADILHYTVQYSPDNGANWLPVLAEVTGPRDSNTVTVLLDSPTIPGSLPNGARIRVAASDGYNTAIAISQPFTVKDRKPEAHIIAPVAGETTPAGGTALLRGGAIDAEDGSLSDDALRWTVDGKAVGTGEDVNVPGLAPGNHAVTLTAYDSISQTHTVTATLTILPLAIDQGSAPEMDGFCDDDAYSAGAQVSLKPYGDGGQASVHLVRDNNYLWACFANLKKGALAPGAFVGLRADSNLSRDALAQADDYGFFVKEEGGLFTYAGNGAGGFDSAGPGGLEAQISASAEGGWSAELRIAKDKLGGWDHLAGLNFGHYWVGFQGDDYHWPYNSGYNQPNLWATTALGAQPQIASLTPNSATAGDPGFTLSISGTNFISGTQVLWDGVALPTLFGSSSLISATVGAPQPVNAGLINVMVRNPGNIDSGPALFTVRNPLPALTTVTPDTAPAGSGNVVITLNGSNFRAGAKVLWDGQELPTTFVNASQLTAQATVGAQGQPQMVNVTVLNPDPDGQSSNTVFFGVQPQGSNPAGNAVYLPVIQR